MPRGKCPRMTLRTRRRSARSGLQAPVVPGQSVRFVDGDSTKNSEDSFVDFKAFCRAGAKSGVGGSAPGGSLESGCGEVAARLAPVERARRRAELLAPLKDSGSRVYQTLSAMLGSDGLFWSV